MMRFSTTSCVRVTAAVLSFQLMPATVSAESYPIEYWALRDVVSNVEVSPDGKKLALMRIPTKDGNPVIEVYHAANLHKAPFRINADPMEIISFDWVGDADIVVSFRQKVRDKIDGFNEGVYEYRLAMLDVKREKIDEFREINPTLENLLPNDADKVIISFNPGSDRSSKIDEAFRPRAYYELDLDSGAKKLLIQGQITLGQVEFDANGKPWQARGYDRGTDELLWYIRRPGATDWEEVYRQHENSFENFEVLGPVPGKPNQIYVLANNGQDKEALWEFDIDRKAFGEILYGRSDVDIAGVRYHSNAWTNPDEIVGAVYLKDKLHVEYWDATEAATYAQLESLIPGAHEIYITSRSREDQTLTVYNVGPHDPGTYYLIKEGHLVTIGSKQPLLKSEDLADVRYITYAARDGRSIPGYITLPRGEPPFPTIVLPHGGPFVSERVSWDEWGQLLANQGYLVLQPQYRGSRNYGLEFYQSAFINGGQGGFKMQDDKDDGIAYLVKEGLTDPARVAMFGWSYGGYAALVAAARTPQIYQCVVAGAAVSDPLMQVSYYSDIIRGAGEIEQVSMWRDSVSPITQVEKVNVPILLVHGNVDQRVPPVHVRKYLAELEKYDKPHKYVELDGADHFSNTLFFHHQLTLFQSLVDFLKTDCGPGGL
ncbi:MAG TPA: prolyl oligopeptidase family serine peptidase [Xanthomonadales bacterium]|nr:prolyl oligopeptidase family serine peptidase [Xanthomonadales bacterium]